MIASRTAGQVQAASTTKPISLDTAAVDHAVRIIHQVCCFAGSFDLLDEFRDDALRAAVERHDTPALFDRLIHDFSFQGISDEIAENYMRRHGQATWRSVQKNLAREPSCPNITVVIFCWRILLISESMGHHDSEIMDDRSID